MAKAAFWTKAKSSVLFFIQMENYKISTSAVMKMMLLLMDVNQLDLQLIRQPAPVLEIFVTQGLVTQYVKPSTSNLRKMRTSKIHFLGFLNSKNYEKSIKF